MALARALVVEPEILLLDEPLSNLDANLREEMRFEIRRLHDAYRYTTLYVTHDQAEAMTTADLIVVMNQGRIEQVGSPEDVYQRPRSEFVARFIGGTNILRGRQIGDGLVDCGGVVLRCGEGEYGKGGEAAVSIRLHDIGLSARGTGGRWPAQRGARARWRGRPISARIATISSTLDGRPAVARRRRRSPSIVAERQRCAAAPAAGALPRVGRLKRRKRRGSP